MKTDEQFQADIKAGNSWETNLWHELAKYLHGLPQPEQVEHMGDRVLGGFGYAPDMAVPSSIEAKIRLAGNFRFTSAKDFPFQSIIVNEVYKTHQENITSADYLRLKPLEQLVYMKPFHSYWIASCDMTHVALIRPATKPLWFQQQMWSPKDRRYALNWLCPLNYPNGTPAVLFGAFPNDVPQLLTQV